jgi:membrane protein DedA with SNARE-associated domain
MVQSISKFSIYVSLYLSIWFFLYLLPGILFGVIMWDRSVYYSSVIDPIYALVFGTVSMYVSRYIVHLIDKGDYI